MKRVIQASRRLSYDDMRRKLEYDVILLAHYAYDNSNLPDDDLRGDFVEAVVKDPEVVSKQAELLEAIHAAIDKQL